MYIPTFVYTFIQNCQLIVLIVFLMLVIATPKFVYLIFSCSSDSYIVPVSHSYILCLHFSPLDHWIVCLLCWYNNISCILFKAWNKMSIYSIYDPAPLVPVYSCQCNSDSDVSPLFSSWLLLLFFISTLFHSLSIYSCHDADSDVYWLFEVACLLRWPIRSTSTLFLVHSCPLCMPVTPESWSCQRFIIIIIIIIIIAMTIMMMIII